MSAPTASATSLPADGSGARLPVLPLPTWHAGLARIGLLVGVVLSALGGLSIVSGDIRDQVALAAVMAIGLAASALVLRHLTLPLDRPFLRSVLLAGILIRVGLALLVHDQLTPGFFAPDQITFQDVGWRTLRFLQGEGARPEQIARGVEVGYFYWNAFLFWIFGSAPLAPKLVNCFLGAWTGLVAYRIGGELVGRGGARTSALLVTFFPSLVLWSTQNLRDPAVLLILGLILLNALQLRLRFSFSKVVTTAVLLAALTLLRDYMAVMVTFALVASFLISPGQRLVINLALGATFFALAVFAYQRLGLTSEMLDSASFEMLNAQRQNLAAGGTAFQPDVDISTPLRGLQYLPVGITFFLFAPFPWQLGSLLSLLTLPEMVVWYLLFPAVIAGAWFLLKERFNRVEPILLFVVITTLIYALVQGNAGTAYRHRAQVVAFLLIFASVGIEVWRVRRLHRRGGRA